MAEGNKSVGWVVSMLAGVVAFAGWGFLAAHYFQNVDESAAGEANFFMNAFEQLPNFVSVIRYGFSDRLWMIGLIAVLEVAVIVIGIVMKKMEAELEGKPRSGSRAKH